MIHTAKLLITTPLGKALSTTAAFIGAWWVGAGPLIQTLIIGMGIFFWLDVILGIGVSLGIRKEKLESQKLFRAMWKMGVYFSVFILAYLMDRIFNVGFGHSAYVCQLLAVLWGFTNEATSILEHLKELEPLTGIKVPAFIGKKLKNIQHLGETEAEAEEPEKKKEEEETNEPQETGSH